MQLCPLSAVKQRIALGVPLPFDVCDGDRTLLLARGQVIENQAQLDALLERGALVDADELRGPCAEIHEAPVHALPGLWGKCMDRMGTVLRASVNFDFLTALDAATRPVRALIERDPDLAIFQIVRPEGGTRAQQYGVAHSLHVAIASQLAAHHLGWDKARTQTLFKAAMTMNLGMLELQGRLALQVTPLTAAQRDAIRDHPSRGVEMLQAAGVNDDEWLQAVAQHHEEEGGSGYPQGLQQVGELASLLHRADLYTAKLSPRVSRLPVAAHHAAREMFTQDHGNPLTAALVKAFGVYPPGCCVRLASGEVGLVVKRGASANTPVVASLTNRNGDPMIEPVRRNTAQAEHAIVDVVNEQNLRVRVSPEKLVVLASG